MLSDKDLENAGLKYNGLTDFDEDISYDSWSVDVGESYFSVQNEMDADGNFKKQIYTLNDRELDGKPPTVEFIKLLIEHL